MAKYYVKNLENYAGILRQKRHEQQQAMAQKYRENREMKYGRRKIKQQLPKIGSKAMVRASINISQDSSQASHDPQTAGSRSHRQQTQASLNASNSSERLRFMNETIKEQRDEETPRRPKNKSMNV